VFYYVCMCALPGKAVPKMTYTVLCGTLNPAHSNPKMMLENMTCTEMYLHRGALPWTHSGAYNTPLESSSLWPGEVKSNPTVSLYAGLKPIFS